MKLFNNLYQNLFFRGLDLFRGRHNIARLNFLRDSQYWDNETLAGWQLRKLNHLLKTAQQYSQFYNDKLRAINLPLPNLLEIQRLPIFTKKEMRGDLQLILCKNANEKHLEKSKTGGSTGEPSYYYLDRDSKDWNRGSVYRSAEWADIFLGDKTAQMMGSHFDVKEFQKLKWKIIFFLQRYRDLPVATVSDELFDQYYHYIQEFKPTSIWGYASGIYMFARFIKEKYPNSDFGFLHALITSSETLRPEWREEINNVFGGTKVFDHYGSREMYIGSECKEHNGYHIHAENIILEIVDNAGRQLPKGEMGRVLVTDLTNLSFPFIRYEIGDVGVLSRRRSCPCGVNLPILEKIEGRVADIIVLKDRKLTPPNFTILMSDLKGVEQYQIIQDVVDNLDVKIVKNGLFSQDTEQYIQGSLEQLVGPTAGIRIEYVDEISVPLSGKRRYIISNIASELL